MFDLVVIGMGSAGITAAEFAARLDLRVAVVERARPGGDCLWTGCVPSKALAASARVAHTMRTADRVGLTPVEPTIDLSTVWRRLRAVQAEIAATDDNPQRFRDMGVEVFQGEARVTAPDAVAVTAADGTVTTLATRFVLVATGSRPAMPDIPGLAEVQPLTSESLFAHDAPPSSVAIIGGGPMGVETAQSLRRLGVTVTLFHRGHTLLPREEPALVERLTRVLEAEGVVVHRSADVRQVARTADGRVRLTAAVGHDGASVTVDAGAVLVAAGRVPSCAGLGLEELGIPVGPAGIEADAAGRTAVRSVYAVGDVTGRSRLTNSAGHAAVVAVRDMFFPGRGSTDRAVPWCVFTDPELAHVGLTVEEAEEAYGADADAWRFDLAHNDRARTDATTEGSLVVVTGKGGRVIGAHVLAPHAGEIVHELALAVNREMRLDEVAELVHVYPTLAGAVGQLAIEAAFEKAHRLRWLMKRR